MKRIPFAFCTLLLLAAAIPSFSQSTGSRAGTDADLTMLAPHQMAAIWNISSPGNFDSADNLTVADGTVELEHQRKAWPIANSPIQDVVPSLDIDSKDNLVATWWDSTYDAHDNVYARVFDITSGNPKINIINVSNNGMSHFTSVGINEQNRFFIVWEDHRTWDYDLYGKIYNSSTGAQIGGEISVSIGSEHQKSPKVASDSNGNFIVAWQDNRGGDWNIYAKRYNQSGALLGNQINVSTGANDQQNPSVAADGRGNFVVAWSDNRSGDYFVCARVFNCTTGSEVGSEITIDAAARWTSNTAVGMDERGRFILVWDDRHDDWDVYARGFDAATGSPIGPKINVSGAKADQWRPSVATDSKGDVIITWIDGRIHYFGDIYYRKFNMSTGIPAGEEICVANSKYEQSDPDIVVDSKDEPIIAWEVGSYPKGDIYAKVFTPQYQAIGQLITRDLVANLIGCTGLSMNITCPNQAENHVSVQYSTDSGGNWSQVPVNGSLAGVSTASGKIRLKVELATTDELTSPKIGNMTVRYAVNNEPVFVAFPADCQLSKNRPQSLHSTISDIDGDTLDYRWTLVQHIGASIFNTTAPNSTFLANRSGNYTVCLNVSDGYVSVGRYFNITVMNHPPAIFGAFSVQAQKNAAMPLVLSAKDDDGDPLSFDWQFIGDHAGATLNDSKDPSPSLNATKAGNLTLLLTVSDIEGANTSARLNVTVTGRPPIPTLSSNKTAANLSESVLFNATKSYDPDGDVLLYRFDFGDGNRTIWQASNTCSHAYPAAGKYSVYVEVNDTDGNIALSQAVNITVVNHPPVAAFAFSTLSPFDCFNYTFTSISTDPDGTVAKFDWDFGDGTTGTGPNMNHSYTGFGNYKVRLTVTDDLGASNSTLQLVAMNHPPLITGAEPATPITLLKGKETRFSVTATDADGDTLAYCWTLNNVTIAGATDAGHVYKPEKAGIYILRLSIADGKSEPVTMEWAVKVKDVKQDNNAASANILPAIVLMVVIAAAGVAVFLGLRWKRPPSAQ